MPSVVSSFPGESNRKPPFDSTMACLLQKVLIVNFLLDVVAFCLGVSGNPLFYAITTRRVAEAVGCLDGNTEGASAAWPLIRQVCSLSKECVRERERERDVGIILCENV